MNENASDIPADLPEAGLKFLQAAHQGNIGFAAACLERHPDSINAQDPQSGVTALHIAILRQDVPLVELLTAQPSCDAWLRDRFNRSAADMLVYTSNRTIFEAVIAKAYPDQEAMWPDP